MILRMMHIIFIIELFLLYTLFCTFFCLLYLKVHHNFILEKKKEGYIIISSPADAVQKVLAQHKILSKPMILCPVIERKSDASRADVIEIVLAQHKILSGPWWMLMPLRMLF